MSPKRRLLEIAKYNASLEGKVWTEPPTDRFAKLNIVQLREECKACVPPLSSGGCKAKLLERLRSVFPGAADSLGAEVPPSINGEPPEPDVPGAPIETEDVLLPSEAPAKTIKLTVGFAEICCGPKSKVAGLGENEPNVETNRTTIDHDLTTPAGLESA